MGCRDIDFRVRSGCGCVDSLRIGNSLYISVKVDDGIRNRFSIREGFYSKSGCYVFEFNRYRGLVFCEVDCLGLGNEVLCVNG